ncbi:SAM hydrolase/SAM-dependent halogenase family protein [Rhodohalobacter sp. 8-1]|uniref:SAM hydrolase/SAM-dependent halogenase family protein n=1 Tax=Rhodohalobacter sp. 8-1 TaxID=3131972 RepID=UPI0030EB893C
MPSLITLTTDFGVKDHYVGVLKAVLLSIAPDTRLVDISHQIPPQDIMAGAWVVRNSAMLFPPGSVHLVVVDPGVGTQRKPIAIKIEDQYFVGPDNGTFSLIADQYDYKGIELTNSKFWRPNPSQTFHGRDIFAPVAAHLANGVDFSELGQPIEKLETYRWAVPISDKDGVQGWIVHIDHFGNLISNIPESMIREAGAGSDLKIYVGNTIFDTIVNTFGDVPDGEPAAYIGSSGVLEIAINKGDAREMLGVEKGAQISIVVQK